MKEDILNALKKTSKVFIGTEFGYLLTDCSYYPEKKKWRILYESKKLQKQIEITLSNEEEPKIEFYVKKISDQKFGYWYINLFDYLSVERKSDEVLKKSYLTNLSNINSELDSFFSSLGRIMDENLKSILFGNGWANVSFDWGDYK